MGEETPVKAMNVVRCLEEDRVTVVQGVFERVADGPDASSRTADQVRW